VVRPSWPLRARFGGCYIDRMQTFRLVLEIVGSLYSVASVIVNLPLVRESKWAAWGRRLVLEVKQTRESLGTDAQ
jgi:hypothetical protein